MDAPSLPERPPVGNIYPELFASEQAYRVSEIRRVRDQLQDETQRRGVTLRRYKRAANAFTYLSTACNCLAAAAGGGAVATLSIGVTAPASLALGALALGSGAVATAAATAGSLLAKRVTKHERIATAASTHFDTISAVVSKALADQTISHDEYAAVLRQLDHYRRQKETLRAGARAEAKPKNDDIRAQVRDEVRELFGAPGSSNPSSR